MTSLLAAPSRVRSRFCSIASCNDIDGSTNASCIAVVVFQTSSILHKMLSVNALWRKNRFRKQCGTICAVLLDCQRMLRCGVSRCGIPPRHEIQETGQCREAMDRDLPKEANKDAVAWAARRQPAPVASVCAPNAGTKSPMGPDSRATANRVQNVGPR